MAAIFLGLNVGLLQVPIDAKQDRTKRSCPGEEDAISGIANCMDTMMGMMILIEDAEEEAWQAGYCRWISQSNL